MSENNLPKKENDIDLYKLIETFGQEARYKAETEQKSLEFQDKNNQRQLEFALKKQETDSKLLEKIYSERSKYKWIIAVFIFFVIITGAYFIVIKEIDAYLKLTMPILTLIIGAWGGYGYGFKKASENYPNNNE
ncbi:MAG: hypothetical protein A2017_06525 [Lentisphaerae bacterium GWF2_44_16]|nr:MAG: hypothetical protein A2017_06525 [Lentisphaerae bacterium GWF2_44_16]